MKDITALNDFILFKLSFKTLPWSIEPFPYDPNFLLPYLC